jgi:hypothetical protein
MLCAAPDDVIIGQSYIVGSYRLDGHVVKLPDQAAGPVITRDIAQVARGPTLRGGQRSQRVQKLAAAVQRPSPLGFRDPAWPLAVQPGLGVEIDRRHAVGCQTGAFVELGRIWTVISGRNLGRRADGSRNRAT